MRFKAYIRVSTDQQAESGLGLEAQKHICTEYAKKNGHEIFKFYEDEGYSGSLSVEKRPFLLQAVVEIEKGDILLVAKRDRLGRDVFITSKLEYDINRKGAKIVSCADEGTHNDDPASLLMRRIVDSFGEYERNMIKVRTKAAMAVKKRRNECVGKVPYGFKLAENGINLMPNDAEQTIITYIMCLRKTGYPYRRIADELNFEGKFNRTGGKWNHVSVFNLVIKWRKGTEECLKQ